MITTTPTNHIKTNIEVIRAFLGDSIRIDIEEHRGHLHKISITS